MNEVSAREAFRPIILRWFILGAALLYVIGGSLGWWILPDLLTVYFIQTVVLITAVLFLNLIWFVILFSHGQIVVDRLIKIVTYTSLVVDLFLAGLVFLFFGQDYPEVWWLLLWPVVIAAPFNKSAGGTFLAIVVLPVIYLKLATPSLTLTSNLNILIFISLGLVVIARGTLQTANRLSEKTKTSPFWQKQKQARAETAVDDSFKIKYEEANRRLYAKDLEVKLIKQELSTLEEAKSKFIAVTAHQMRTPLSAVKWTFNILRDGSMGKLTDEQIEFVKKGEEATEKMIGIINHLVTVDSIVTVADPTKLAPVDLTSLLTDTLAEFANQLKSHKVISNLQKPEGDLPLILADYAKLKMVFENLIDNAIKYSLEGTTVAVIISDENLNTANSSLTIKISDQGIGIPKKEQTKIFSKFFRAKNAVIKEPDGSGVGLFIAKDIVEEHGGSLRFESEEGKGTTFFISLPVKAR